MKGLQTLLNGGTTMKKYLLILITLLTFSLYACSDIPTNDDIDETIESGIFGADDITLTVGNAFDPNDGVSARDEDGVDITEDIEILGLEHLDIVDGQVSASGEFVLVYQTESYTTSRVVTILNDNNDEDNIDEEDEDLTTECGNPVIGDYVITWCDEFTGQGDNLNAYGVDLDKWAFQTGTGAQYGLNGWGNNEAQYYREENARVENDRLIIELRQEPYEDKNYTSARLWTKPTFHQTYGRFEASIKLPVGDGLWPAYWMMPQDDVYGGWAASGEIDIMEAKGRLPYESSGALHFGGSWPDNTYDHGVYHFPSGNSIAEFNTYAVEWEEDEIRWYVNDILMHTATSWYTDGHPFPAPFDQDFYLILNLAVGGSFDGGILPPDSLFDAPVLMEIEYVRVYQKQAE